MRILLVFGTRPEAIKMAPVYRKCADRWGDDVRVCVTGQHREMLDQVLRVFGIKPHFDLSLMKPNQTLSGLTAGVLIGLENVYKEFAPQLILVQGDTTTTFAAALSAFYCGIQVGHVEAGLRTWDLTRPFPEEANRLLVARLARYHFCPTQINRDNLLREGVHQDRIHITGNTGIDALQMGVKVLGNGRAKSLLEERSFGGRRLRPAAPLVLVTTHRRENFGSGLEAICRAVVAVAKARPDADIILPVHPNPNVKQEVIKCFTGIENILMCEPLAYDEFLVLLNHCSLVLTDSGGVQEEAPSLGKRVLVLRDKTERVETLQQGRVELVGSDMELIVSRSLQFLEDARMVGNYDQSLTYGDGRASDRIAEILASGACL